MAEEMRRQRRSTAPDLRKAVVAVVMAVLLFGLGLPAAWRTPPAAAQTVQRVAYVATSLNDSVRGIDVDVDGNVYVGGETSGEFDGFTNPGLGSYKDGFVRQYTPTGVGWTVQFDLGDDEVWGVALDGSANVYVAGSSWTGDTLGWQAFVRKYTNAGELAWSTQFGAADTDEALALDVSDDGVVFVVGETAGSLVGAELNGYTQAFVRAYDPDATTPLLWTQEYGAADVHDSADDVATNAAGTVIAVSGETSGDLVADGHLGGADAYVRTYDGSGSAVWTDQLGTTTYDSGRAVALGPDGTVHVGLQTAGAFDGFTNASGYDGAIRKYSTAGTSLWTRQFSTATNFYPEGIAVDAAGMSHLVGQVQGTSSTGLLVTADATGAPDWTFEMVSSYSAGAHDVAVRGGSAYIGGFADGTLYGVTDPQPGNQDGAMVVVRETVFTAPSVSDQPDDTTVKSGTNATFTAAASGEPTPTVQWEVLTTDPGATWEALGGETSTTLVVAATSGQNGDQYRAVFTNGSGTATTDPATLTVTPSDPVVITNPNTTVSSEVGGTVSLEAIASADPRPSAQWQVLTTATGATWTNVGGSTDEQYSSSSTRSTLSLTGLTLAMDGYQYRAVFSTGSGTDATTTVATLDVLKPVVVMGAVTGSFSKGAVTVSFDPAAATNDPTEFRCALDKKNLVWTQPCPSGTVLKGNDTTVLVQGFNGRWGGSAIGVVTRAPRVP